MPYSVWTMQTLTACKNILSPRGGTCHSQDTQKCLMWSTMCSMVISNQGIQYSMVASLVRSGLGQKKSVLIVEFCDQLLNISSFSTLINLRKLVHLLPQMQSWMNIVIVNLIKIIPNQFVCIKVKFPILSRIMSLFFIFTYSNAKLSHSF